MNTQLIKTKAVFDLNLSAELLMLSSDMPEYREFEELLLQAGEIAMPKAVIVKLPILQINDGEVKVPGATFTSTKLVELMSKGSELCVFVATCGTELEQLLVEENDPLRIYWIEHLKEKALQQVFELAKMYSKEKMNISKITSMVPIDSASWQLADLQVLFNLIPDNILQDIDVSLSEHFSMYPNKSRAGVFFYSTEVIDLCKNCSFKESCELRFQEKSCSRMM
ncbi:MAG: hypothetical protein GY750_20620 [Lentisphaerae bacterium]|nr:hypothetical protein [Lentisphaerota bacterium]MCP4103797.1 hypothetical protein [Lentisphaerota bacterium]